LRIGKAGAGAVQHLRRAAEVHAASVALAAHRCEVLGSPGQAGSRIVERKPFARGARAAHRPAQGGTCLQPVGQGGQFEAGIARQDAHPAIVEGQGQAVTRGEQGAGVAFTAAADGLFHRDALAKRATQQFGLIGECEIEALRGHGKIAGCRDEANPGRIDRGRQAAQGQGVVTLGQVETGPFAHEGKATHPLSRKAGGHGVEIAGVDGEFGIGGTGGHGKGEQGGGGERRPRGPGR
jgi:hypothetical protein